MNLFTEDGRIGMGPGENSVRGHENLLKMYTEALGDLAPRPFIHNHVIQLQSANEAIGTCYVEIAGIRDGESLVAAGYYDDVYHKVNGVWKFQARDVTMHYMTSLREGWADAIMKRAQERAGT